MEIGIIGLATLLLIGFGLALAKLKTLSRGKKELYVVSHSKFRFSEHDPVNQRVSQDCLTWIAREEGKRGC